MGMESIEDLYLERLRAPDAMSKHMPTLRNLAEECKICVEFGVRRANSTVALLAGGSEVISYDLEQLPQHRQLHDRIKAAAGDRWSGVLIGDSREFELSNHCIDSIDLLLLDSCHNAEQVRAELRHADKVRRYLSFHDTVSHGLVGQRAPDTIGQKDHDVKGIMFAICEFLTTHREWREKAHYGNDAGLLVLEQV